MRIASTVVRPSSRSAEMAKSTIMMPFFLTMPIRRIVPIRADQAELVAEQHQSRERAQSRRRQRRENGQRVDEALVEHAEDQIDARRAQQGSASGTVVSESWNACALPWKVVVRPRGSCSSRSARWTASVAVPSATPWARLKLMVIAGKLALVTDRQRRDRSGRPFREGAERHHLTGRRRAEYRSCRESRGRPGAGAAPPRSRHRCSPG